MSTFDPTKPFTTCDGRDVTWLLHGRLRGPGMAGIVDGLHQVWNDAGKHPVSDSLDLVNVPDLPADPAPSAETDASLTQQRHEAEEARCAHLWLNAQKIDRGDANGNFSLIGRIRAALASSRARILASSRAPETGGIVITDDMVKTASRAYDPMAWHGIDQAAGVHGMLETLRLQLLTSMRAALTAALATSTKEGRS